jgi:hypothetical protein
MTDQLKVPDDVAGIIAEKRLAMEMERKDKEVKERAERTAKIEQGKKFLREKIELTLMAVPAWLRQYDVTEFNWDERDLELTDRALKNIVLVFHIPGLAPIQFNSESNNWRAAQAYEEWNGDWSTPTIKFNNSSYWRTDLEYTLIEAEQEMQNYDELQARYEMRKMEAQISAAEDSQREQESEHKQEGNLLQEKTEAETLFAIFKDDPVAVNLLKAFLMIRQERTIFEAQLEDANSSLYSMEEHWTRKAADLRRQADAAERRASEEFNRANDLEDDLSKANKKVKESQRGW